MDDGGRCSPCFIRAVHFPTRHPPDANMDEKSRRWRPLCTTSPIWRFLCDCRLTCYSKKPRQSAVGCGLDHDRLRPRTMQTVFPFVCTCGPRSPCAVCAHSLLPLCREGRKVRLARTKGRMRTKGESARECRRVRGGRQSGAPLRETLLAHQAASLHRVAQRCGADLVLRLSEDPGKKRAFRVSTFHGTVNCTSTASGAGRSTFAPVSYIWPRWVLLRFITSGLSEPLLAFCSLFPPVVVGGLICGLVSSSGENNRARGQRSARGLHQRPPSPCRSL